MTMSPAIWRYSASLASQAGAHSDVLTPSTRECRLEASNSGHWVGRFCAAAWLALAVLTAACSTAPEIEQNKRIVGRVFDEVLNQGQYGLFDEVYAPDFVKHVDGRSATLDEERADARATRAASSDLVMTVNAMVAEGDMVAVRYTGVGTNDGPLGDVPASGRPFSVTGMTLYRFSGGKIVEEWTVYNELEMLRQMGLLQQ